MIFEQKRSWYRMASDSSRRWNIPIPVLMSFIHQESSFRADARPPRGRWFFGLLPSWRRLSNAYGYAQALSETWDLYRKNGGRRGAGRNDFKDAVDFVAWYNRQSVDRLGIDSGDAYNLYFAYHEGWGGYKKRTWMLRGKQWLIPVAHKVSDRALLYGRQLPVCEKELSRRKRFFLF